MLTPFEHHIVHKLKETKRREFASTKWVAKKCDMTYWQAIHYLYKLEKLELISRPGGTRSGWAFKPQSFDLVILETLTKYEKKVRGTVTTDVLAERMNIKERTMRYHLRRLEEQGGVVRPHGPRCGYQCKLNYTDWRVLGLLRNESRPKLYRTEQVAALVNVPERTARHYLRRLEMAGAVRRPLGPKSGWMVA